MNKLFVLAATVVLAVGFVGCAKEDNAPAMKDIKVEFSVADKDGFAETRAVKNAWADGDQILVLFKPNGSAWLGAANSKDNTLTLTYSASTGWSATKNNWGETLVNSTNGEFLAVHYRGDMAVGEDDAPTGYRFNYVAGEVLCMRVGTYTITDGVMILPTLVLELSNDAVQFSVEDLASNSDTWEMWVAYDDMKGSVPSSGSGYDYKYPTDESSPVQGYNARKVLYRTDIGFVGTYSNQWMSNVVNGDDRSFFGTFDGVNGEVTTKYVFVLKNVTKTKYYKFEYAPTPFAKLKGRTAYLLPPLTLLTDGVNPAGDCKWTLLE